MFAKLHQQIFLIISSKLVLHLKFSNHKIKKLVWKNDKKYYFLLFKKVLKKKKKLVSSIYFRKNLMKFF